MTVPFFEFITLTVGPLKFMVWGTMVALGIFLSYLILSFLLEKHYKKNKEVILNLFFWAIISAGVFARIFYIFFYSDGLYNVGFYKIISIWDGGLSSLGGIFGAIIVILIFYLKYKFDLLLSIDLIAIATPWGWAVGRLGCFFIHDHPGYPCAMCIVKQRFGNGYVGIDLGLYESVLWLLIGLSLLVLIKAGYLKNAGEKACFVFCIFFVSRFFLDFMRVLDARYMGLTAAQYTLPALLLLLFFILKMRKY